MQALKGNPGKRAKRPPSIRPSGDVYIPNYLQGDARDCFEMITAAMPPATYASTDVGGIAVYATAWADHKKATEALQIEPSIVPGSTGNLQPNPWFKIKNESARIMMALGDNAAWDLPAGDRASFLGYIDLGTPFDLGSTCYVETNNVNKQVQLASANLFGYLVTNGAFTPTSARVQKVALHTVAV